jgi:hypothetical protein
VVNNLQEIGLAIAKARRRCTFVVGSSKSTPPNRSYHLIERSGHPASIKWYQFSGCSVRIPHPYIRSVFLSPIIHTKSHKNRIRSSYPNQSEPSQFSFRCFALLNYRLHRRVQLLVLVSSPLEFRVQFTLVTAAAAPSSHPLPTSIIHHRKREKRVEKRERKKRKKRKKKEKEKKQKNFGSISS